MVCISGRVREGEGEKRGLPASRGGGGGREGEGGRERGDVAWRRETAGSMAWRGREGGIERVGGIAWRARGIGRGRV